MIVGNIIGETALAGIGVTSTLYNLFVTMLVEFTSGLSVLFAQQFGKGKQQNNKNLLANYTLLLIGIFTIISVLVSIKGYLEGTFDLLFSGIAGICSLVVRILCSYLFENVWENMTIAYAEAFAWVFLLVVFICRYYVKQKKK